MMAGANDGRAHDGSGHDGRAMIVGEKKVGAMMVRAMMVGPMMVQERRHTYVGIDMAIKHVYRCTTAVGMCNRV